MEQTGLLILLDEPFAGVTDDFVPWIVERLQHMGEKHNVLVVTNDYVSTLSEMADTTIQLSAIDRTVVSFNQRQTDRDIAILALSLGSGYTYKGNESDWKFFVNVEIFNSKGLKFAAIWIAVSYTLFLFTFWDSAPENAGLVLIANELLGYFDILPFLLTLTDWRHYVGEESEALLHSSKNKSRVWKSCVAFGMLFFMTLFQFGMVNAVVDGLESIDFFFGIFFDCFFHDAAYIILGLYSSLPNETVFALASLPCIGALFFSTTYSPGAGLPVVKELRYLFPRFYLWCMVPGVQDDMEGCPANHSVNMVLMALSATSYVWLFFGYLLARKLFRKYRQAETQKKRQTLEKSHEVRSLRSQIFDGKVGPMDEADDNAGWDLEETPPKHEPGYDC